MLCLAQLLLPSRILLLKLHRHLSAANRCHFSNLQPRLSRSPKAKPNAKTRHLTKGERRPGRSRTYDTHHRSYASRGNAFVRDGAEPHITWSGTCWSTCRPGDAKPSRPKQPSTAAPLGYDGRTQIRGARKHDDRQHYYDCGVLAGIALWNL